MVGDHMRILAVVRFCFGFIFFAFPHKLPLLLPEGSYRDYK
jgi:hypothetical protein